MKGLRDETMSESIEVPNVPGVRRRTAICAVVEITQEIGDSYAFSLQTR